MKLKSAIIIAITCLASGRVISKPAEVTAGPAMVSYIKCSTEMEPERLIIEFRLTEEDKPGISISNSSGNTIYEANGLFFNNSFEHLVNTASWQADDYYITVYTSGGDITQKIHIAH